jgi:hypothetical protein
MIKVYRSEATTQIRVICQCCNGQAATASVLEQRRERTRGLKQAMMQELLTGKTRPPLP